MQFLGVDEMQVCIYKSSVVLSAVLQVGESSWLHGVGAVARFPPDTPQVLHQSKLSRLDVVQQMVCAYTCVAVAHYGARAAVR